jgi:hypothetical protein
MAADVSVLMEKLNELTRERNKLTKERDTAVAEREKTAEALKMLVARVHFDDGRCKACSREIYWIRHRAGAITPYDRDGIMHVNRCSGARQFSRGPKQPTLYEGMR